MGGEIREEQEVQESSASRSEYCTKPAEGIVLPDENIKHDSCKDKVFLKRMKYGIHLLADEFCIHLNNVSKSQSMKVADIQST